MTTAEIRALADRITEPIHRAHERALARVVNLRHENEDLRHEIEDLRFALRAARIAHVAAASGVERAA